MNLLKVTQLVATNSSLVPKPKYVCVCVCVCVCVFSPFLPISGFIISEIIIPEIGRKGGKHTHTHILLLMAKDIFLFYNEKRIMN